MGQVKSDPEQARAWTGTMKPPSVQTRGDKAGGGGRGQRNRHTERDRHRERQRDGPTERYGETDTERETMERQTDTDRQTDKT